MKDGISPEEKLLKLIRGPKKQPLDFPTEKQPATPELKQALKFPKFSFIKKYLPAIDTQKIIILLFSISCIYLISSFIYPYIGLRKISLPKVTTQKLPEKKIAVEAEERPLEFYLQGMGDRQIFGSASRPETQKVESAVNVDLMKDIGLVGIISGENPQAIIEDKKTQKAFYVTKGQFVGEFMLEDIQEGKVILNYNGQRYELYL